LKQIDQPFHSATKKIIAASGDRILFPWLKVPRKSSLCPFALPRFGSSAALPWQNTFDPT
jgi:hypothetical protein